MINFSMLPKNAGFIQFLIEISLVVDFLALEKTKNPFHRTLVRLGACISVQ